MPRPCMMVGLSCLLVACSSRTLVQDSSETSVADATTDATSESGSTATSETTANASTTTTAPPACDPDACSAQCGEMTSDECDLPFVGWCTGSGECICEDPPCPECVTDEDCGPWASCGGGWCYPCGEMDIPWDPAVGCAIPLEGFEPAILPFSEALLDGELLPFDDTGTCVQYPNAFFWTLDVDPVLHLCPDSCAAYEAGSVLTYYWCIAGE